MRRDYIYLFIILWLLMGLIMKPKVKVEEKIVYLEAEAETEIVYIVTATVYNAVEGQCDDTPLLTSCGKNINPENPYGHRYIAVSHDLLDVFPYGTEVVVSGTGDYDGVWVVADTMNKRFRGYIDFLINVDMKGGKWSGVRIKKNKI